MLTLQEVYSTVLNRFTLCNRFTPYYATKLHHTSHQVYSRDYNMFTAHSAFLNNPCRSLSQTRTRASHLDTVILSPCRSLFQTHTRVSHLETVMLTPCTSLSQTHTRVSHLDTVMLSPRKSVSYTETCDSPWHSPEEFLWKPVSHAHT